MSIFVGNDNAYESILGQSKKNKESKNANKTSFANVVRQKLGQKAIALSKSNKETLAMNEALAQNKALDEIKEKPHPSFANSKIPKNADIKIKKSILTQTIINIQPRGMMDEAYGYPYDKDGFMGVEFNEAASLPLDFKIHKSTLDENVRYTEKYFEHESKWLGIKNHFLDYDVASAFKASYKHFTNYLGTNISDKGPFTQSDLDKLPKGYTSHLKRLEDARKGEPDEIISNIYRTNAQAAEAEQLGFDLAMSGISFDLDVVETHFDEDMFEPFSGEGAPYKFNPDMSMYKRDDGKFSPEALFLGFSKMQPSMPIAIGQKNLVVQAYYDSIPVENASLPGVRGLDLEGGLFRAIADGRVTLAEYVKASLAQGLMNEVFDAKTNTKLDSSQINGYCASLDDRISHWMKTTAV